MKTLHPKQRIHLFVRIWTMVLLGVFLNALLFESLHHHEQRSKNSNVEQSVASEGVKTVIDQPMLSCKLCDALKHNSHDFYQPQQLALALQVSLPKQHQFVHVVGKPIALVLSYTNKGPPNLG